MRPGIGSRAARGLLVVPLLLVALGGCTDEPEEVVRTSGALTDGFEIEPGSGLVGAVFPLGYGAGHQAVLRVDGDLPEVLEGYARQAEELGYPVQAPQWLPPGEWCTDPDDRVDDDPREGPFEIECTAYSWAQDRTVSVRGLADSDGRGYIHLQVQPSTDSETSEPQAPDGPVASATDDELAPDLPSSTGDRPVRVVEGSELVSEPFYATCGGIGGYVAVLRVTDALLPVVRGYAEQFTAMPAYTSEGVVGSDDEPSVYASVAGGGDIGAVGVAGDPGYVLIQRCND